MAQDPNDTQDPRLRLCNRRVGAPSRLVTARAPVQQCRCWL